ncbi:hypothetical protein F5Y19DRAFT_488979 [Xylariaceae sp. FL1651]|nr:hypothetical protein F5Y19DRAFT_488979 [Xylariaceae sp. FL1651]
MGATKIDEFLERQPLEEPSVLENKIVLHRDNGRNRREYDALPPPYNDSDHSSRQSLAKRKFPKQTWEQKPEDRSSAKRQDDPRDSAWFGSKVTLRGDESVFQQFGIHHNIESNGHRNRVTQNNNIVMYSSMMVAVLLVIALTRRDFFGNLFDDFGVYRY